MPELIDLPLSVLEVSPQNLSRFITGTVPDVVHIYAELMKDGYQLPPIGVLQKENGKKYLVWDGIHRFEAAKGIGLKTVMCQLEDFPEEEILLRSLSENIKHGLPLKKEEKVMAVQSLFQDGFSIKAINEKTGIPQRTLRRWLKPSEQKNENERLKRIQKLMEKGLTQEEVSKEIGISQGRISQIMKNDKNIRSINSGQMAKIKIDDKYNFVQAGVELYKNRALSVSEINNNSDPDGTKNLTQKQSANLQPFKEPLSLVDILTADFDRKWKPGERKTLRALEFIKADWDINSIAKKLGETEIWVRNTAAALLGLFHYKDYLEPKESDDVAELLSIKDSRVNYIDFYMRYFSNTLPDRKAVFNWLVKNRGNNSDKAISFFLRSEKIYYDCLQRGVDPPWTAEKGKPKALDKFPKEYENQFREFYDFIREMIELTSSDVFRKPKVIKDVQRWFNFIIIECNRFNDLIKNHE